MTRAGERARALVTALSIRDDHSSTSGRYTLTDEEDDRVDLKLNPVAGRRWVDPRARWVAASLAPHLHADSPEHARDILTATVLCECSYKSPEAHVRERVAELSREFPPFAVRLSGVSASVEGRARRRYLVARAPGVTYVAFTGTREAMDFLADASFLQTPLAEGLGLGSDVKSSGGGRPMVHRGFAARAREVRAHVRAAWRRARERGDRFVLCGHSLGGAVATLAAVAILAESDESQSTAELRCVAFASPPVGNSALRRAVWERGWGPAFTNVCVPEDPVPRLLFTPQQRAAAAKVDGPRQPPTRDNSREANAARRLPRLVPMVRRSDETQGDGKGSAGKSSYLRAAGRAIRPEYVHMGPVHHLLRGGGIVSSDGHATSDDEGGAAGAAGGDVAATDETREGGPGAIAAVRHAVLRHTMRTYRARMVELCDGAVRTGRAAKQGSYPRHPPSSTGSLPRPVGTAMDAAPNPRPMIAVAVISVGEDGASFAASTFIRGTDLDLCDVKAGVKAEVRGWPCVVAASPMGSSELAVRVSAPSFNGEKLPDADAGGPSTFGWEPMILSCGGDFGDARIAARMAARRVWVTAGDDVEMDDVEDVADAFRETDGGWIDFRFVPVEPRRWIRRLLGSLGGAPPAPTPGDVFVVVTAADVAEDGATVRVTPGMNVRDARRALLGALQRTERDALAHAAGDVALSDPRRRKSPFRQGFTFGAAAAAGAAFGAALRRDFEGEG